MQSSGYRERKKLAIEYGLKLGQLIPICDKCLRASCLSGDLYCFEYKSAGVIKKTVAELLIETGENPYWWSQVGNRRKRLKK